MRRGYLEHLIRELPLADEQGMTLGANYVNFIQTFTIYYGLNEANVFKKFLVDREFSKKAFMKGTNDENADHLWHMTVRTLKHSFVLSRIWDACWGFDMANMVGVPYLAESSIDLKSALLLYRLGFLKGSLQSLRSVMETSVIHLYLTAKHVSYGDLRDNNERLPPLTKERKGVLAFLTGVKVIDATFAAEITSLYRKLSEAVHSRFQTTSVRYAEEDYAEENYRRRHSYCLNCIKAVSVVCTKLTLCAMRYD